MFVSGSLKTLQINIMEKLWVARDKDGGLYLYNYEPCKNKISGRFTCCIKPNGEWSEEYELNSQLLPDLTYENSPQEVELNLPNLNIVF